MNANEKFETFLVRYGLSKESNREYVMAYSDYGGYAYRNGVRIEDRSDYTITPEGDAFGTPGMWPGWGMLVDGLPKDEIEKRLEWPSGHAILGYGPIYVVLYKQTRLDIYSGPKKLDECSLLVEPKEGMIKVHDCGSRWLNHDYFRDEDILAEFEIDGARIAAKFTQEDNYYLYVRLEQPDGTVWCGWSGYGVGAGLEDCGYGFSTEKRNEMLCSLWEDAINE